MRIFGCVAYRQNEATQRKGKFYDRTTLRVSQSSRDGMYPIHIARVLMMKHASFDKTVFPLDKAIKTEYVSIEGASESDNYLSGHEENLIGMFPECGTQRTFVNNIQTGLNDGMEQQEVKRTLKNPET